VIPKKLHFTYISENLPDKYRENLRKWKALYPDWEVHFYSDEAIYQFFDHYYPVYFHDLQKIPHGVILADVFRYAALYIHGGMYTDIDTIPLKKIPEEWLSYQCVLGYEYQPSKFPEMFRNPHRYQEFLCQWTMLSSPKYPLFKETLDQAFQKLRRKNFHLKSYGEVLGDTGPLHLTSVAKKYMNHPDVLILDADFFGCDGKYNFEFTERSIIHHEFDGHQGWMLEFFLPHLNLNKTPYLSEN